MAQLESSLNKPTLRVFCSRLVKFADNGALQMFTNYLLVVKMFISNCTTSLTGSHYLSVCYLSEITRGAGKLLFIYLSSSLNPPHNDVVYCVVP